MACSNPLRLYKENLKPSKLNNHADFTQSALRSSFGNQEYFEVPCRFCLNCRVDRQNELVDRCEYEYIKYRCGAFVTFTYDDYHNFQNAFLDSKDGEIKYTINKKEGKDFLNRLNKLVHKQADNLKKQGINTILCNPNYKYVITHEYGDKFNRNHIHCLFFGLDFAFCEKLFYKAWNLKGDLQVGAIKEGGIEYCVKYISDQEYGLNKLLKYEYHHMTPPCSSHSLGLGEGLFKSQIKQIKNEGTYRWHNTDRPCPIYWKNKFKVIKDLDVKKNAIKYKSKCNEIYNLYNHRITSYKDFTQFNKNIAIIRQKNLELKLQQKGKQVYMPEYIMRDYYDMKYNDFISRINNNNSVIRILNNDGTTYIKVGKKQKQTLSTTDLMKLHTDYYKLCRTYGEKEASNMCGLSPLPF